MSLWIVRIVELLEQESVLCGSDFFGLGNGTTHTLGGWRQDEFSTKCLEQYRRSIDMLSRVLIASKR
jgi:hypothetical protein